MFRIMHWHFIYLRIIIKIVAFGFLRHSSHLIKSSHLELERPQTLTYAFLVFSTVSKTIQFAKCPNVPLANASCKRISLSTIFSEGPIMRISLHPPSTLLFFHTFKNNRGFMSYESAFRTFGK